MSIATLLPGKLSQAAGQPRPLEVCRSRAGYYIGTLDEQGGPFTRESVEYWPTPVRAVAALAAGSWTQRPAP